MLRRLVILAFLLSAPAYSATVFLTTDQSGGVTGIDLNTSVSWLLNVTSEFDLGGGIFEMKANDPTADISLKLYEGTNNLGTLVVGGTVTLTEASFSNSYNPISFLFGSPITLLAGSSYFVELTSLTGTGGDEQYFIKDDGGPVIIDANGDLVDPQPIDGSAVPEPSTLSLLGLSLSALALFRRNLR